jgi:hypothetical protein
MKIIILTILLLVSINGKYLDSKSCKECHEMIHYEHTTSMHHNSSLFKDVFHYRIKKLTTPDKYSCALCHTPATTNLRAVIDGSEQPSSRDKRQDDGVSCFYCHQITKVLETKHRNINFYSYKENTKPEFFGNISDYGDSDKHKSNSNEIYKNSKVCMGCHGKKYNKHNVQICNGYNELDETSDCISCHMPKFPGGTTKLNKKGREEYTSHEFLGIRDEDMVKKAVKLSLKQLDNTNIELTIKNKMGHSIIMQPMRVKYVETSIERDGQVIWKNFDKYPLEDTKATFTRLFQDDKGARVFPPFAKDIKFNNNIKANSSKVIKYKIPTLKKGDIIKSQWVSYVVRPSLAKSLKLTDKILTKKYLGDSTSLTIVQ